VLFEQLRFDNFHVVVDLNIWKCC